MQYIQDTPKSQSTITTSSSDEFPSKISSGELNTADISTSLLNNKILVEDLHQMDHTIESDPNDVWESLNTRYHNKFGSGEYVKKETKLEDLQWAKKTLPTYILWNKFSEFYLLTNFWIKKVSTAQKNTPNPKNQVGKKVQGKDLNNKFV